MRVVVDHHVDRPGVDAQQCVKLTGTNHSIGLIRSVTLSDKSCASQMTVVGCQMSVCGCLLTTDIRHPCLDDLVAMARGPAPDPIPNSVVKTLSADGTAS